jgi:hypothetical protein
VIALLAAGVTLGISAGFSPGPLLALVVSQTIRYGFREGAKVAFAPVITDFPIIFLSTLLLANLSGTKSVLGLVSIVGGLFLVYLAVENVKTTGGFWGWRCCCLRTCCSGMACTICVDRDRKHPVTIARPAEGRGSGRA